MDYIPVNVKLNNNNNNKNMDHKVALPVTAAFMYETFLRIPLKNRKHRNTESLVVFAASVYDETFAFWFSVKKTKIL